MLKTLAGKHRSTVSKMAAKYKANIDTPHGPRTCFEASVERARQEATGRHGSAESRCRRQKNAVLTDRQPVPATVPPQGADHPAPRGRCELCDAHGRDRRCTTSASSPTSPRPGRPQPAWAQAHGETAAQDPRGLRRLPRRHPHRQPAAQLTAVVTGEPDARKRARPVREGAAGKGPATRHLAAAYLTRPSPRRRIRLRQGHRRRVLRPSRRRRGHDRMTTTTTP